MLAAVQHQERGGYMYVAFALRSIAEKKKVPRDRTPNSSSFPLPAVAVVPETDLRRHGMSRLGMSRRMTGTVPLWLVAKESRLDPTEQFLVVNCFAMK